MLNSPVKIISCLHWSLKNWTWLKGGITLTSPLSSCFRLGFFRNRPWDKELIWEWAQNKLAVVWRDETEKCVFMSRLLRVGGNRNLIPLKKWETMKSTFLRFVTINRWGSASDLLCHWWRRVFGGIKSSSTSYPLQRWVENISAARCSSQVMSGKL